MKGESRPSFAVQSVTHRQRATGQGSCGGRCRRPFPAPARSSAAGRRRCGRPRPRSASVSPRAPPMHSVTFSPVSSKCTPPRIEPSRPWISKARLSSPRMSSKLRVLTPLCVVHRVAVHRVAAPEHRSGRARRTASTSGGRHCSIRPAPKRWMNVSRPGSFVGIEHVDQLEQFVGRHRGADLHADRIGDAAEVLDVRAVRAPACGRRSRESGW